MVRELHVEEVGQPRSWEQQCDLYYEMAVEGVPLPEDFREALGEEYAHLAPAPPVRPPENERAWANYKQWLGDVSEDTRSPRERLTAYFAEQESK